jgi:hypothetical protein
MHKSQKLRGDNTLKYLLLVLLLISTNAIAKESYIYYKDPLSVPIDVYDISCEVTTCKQGYTRAGDVGNSRGAGPACWCSKLKTIKARVLAEMHTADGEPYFIVTIDCEKAWIVYGVDVVDISDK